MDQHEFPHELNPESWRQAVLDNERERFAVELERSKERLLSRFRKFFVATAPLPLVAVVWLTWSSHRLVDFLVWAIFGLGPHAIAILLLSWSIAKARRLLRNWDEIMADCHEGAPKAETTEL